MSFTAKNTLEYLRYPERIQERILWYYNQPHRKYHNEHHLNSLLRWVNPEYDKLHVLLQAIIFHDIFYSSKLVPAGVNEAMSVALFSMAKLRMRDPGDLNLEDDIIMVVKCINATAYHDKDQPNLPHVVQTMLDLDLQSFAQPRDEFLRDTHNVKLEYLPMVGEKAFRKGNRKFLQTMLKRKRLYYNMTAWEQPARENLEWRIKNMDEEP